MKRIYSPREFGLLVGKTTKTLQRWDREGRLKAHRSITARRYYTHTQLLQVMGHTAKKRIVIAYCRVSSVGQKRVVLNR
jgi:putative resolvase